MNIEEYIEKIVRDGKIEDMQEMSNILEDTLDIIKDYDPKCYEEYSMRLYELAYGKKLNREMSENIVSKMRPYGKRWNYEETKQLQEQRGLQNISPCDFFVTMNMGYNDFHNIFGDDVEGYIKFTIDFIEDEDAKEDKVYKYFMM